MESSPTSSSSRYSIRVLDAADSETLLLKVVPPKPGSDVLSALQIKAGPGLLHSLDGYTMLGTDVLQAGVYKYERQQAPAPASGTMESLLKVMESVEKNLKHELQNVEATMGAAVAQLNFWSHMQLQDFRSDSTSSVQRNEFKTHLITHYQPEYNTAPKAQGSSAREGLRCMVTGKCVNLGDVQAGHIIGVKHRQYAAGMHMDVMSARNGILWLSVFERAWTKRQFCFTCPPGDQGVRFTLLDQNLQNMRLVDYPDAVLSRDTKRALGDKTFGQLIGTPLTEPVAADKRPYRRALCFMANVYRKLAETDHWPVPADALDDRVYEYWSDFDAQSKVADWLATI